jgi:hypothetical protein
MFSSRAPSKCFRAATSTYVVAGVIGTVLLAMMMPPHLSHEKESDWNLPVIFAVILVLVLLLIGIYKIEISEDSISYRSPLRGTRSIKYGDIERVQTSITINAGAVSTESRAGPMYRLELYPRATSDVASRIVINMKIFRLEDIRSLLEVLKRKLPNILIE